MGLSCRFGPADTLVRFLGHVRHLSILHRGGGAGPHGIGDLGPDAFAEEDADVVDRARIKRGARHGKRFAQARPERLVEDRLAERARPGVAGRRHDERRAGGGAARGQLRWRDQALVKFFRLAP